VSYSKSTDLTLQEQLHVRTAIRVLHLKCRSWKTIARALKVEPDSIYRVVSGRRVITAAVAFRVARLAGSSIDDLLSGAYLPAGICQHCGHLPDDPK
jgi:plasmid maintenance system antidote protein VapI